MNAGTARQPYLVGGPEDAPVEVPKYSWLNRRLIDLGVARTMAQPETKPPGLVLNYTTVLFYLTVIGFIAAGFWWTWQRAESAGDARGYQRRQMEEMEEKTTDQARQIELLQRAAGLLPPEPKKEKK